MSVKQLEIFIYNYEGQRDSDNYRTRRINNNELNSVWSECVFSSNRKFIG